MITTTGALVGHWMNTLAEHVSLPLVSCGVRVNQSIVLCAVLCEPLFVFCFRFFLFYCFSLFYLSFLITLVSLISSNFFN